MVSMKDIAAECGVSIAAVSKALNGSKDIGNETREKIKQVAEQMGYHPNFSARALKTKKSYNIGVLYNESSGSGLMHNYFAQILDSFKNVAESKGYDITFLSNSKTRKDQMSYLAHALHRGMDGVIIAVADYNDEEVAELLQSDLPVVTIDYMYEGRISVISNNIKGMECLMSYIFEKGHRKIAYIYGDESMVTEDRVSVYYRFHEKNKIKINDNYIVKGKYRDSYIAGVITNKLLDLPEPPDCIIYADDFAAIGGMNVIKNRGMKIPQDISIAGYDGIIMATQLEPPLTTYRQNTKQIGSIAAKELINLIENSKSTKIRQYVVEGELVKGASV